MPTLTADRSRALEILHSASETDPDDGAAQFSVGCALQEMHRWQEALPHYDRAISLDADHAEAYCNRGVVLGQLGRLDEAIASFERSLALKPDRAAAHFNLGCALLLKGELRRGWPHYEWRLRLAGNPAATALPVGTTTPARTQAPAPPLWQGRESLAGKSILLRSEQGLGDTLQFFRYVKPVADLGARVILEVPMPLVSLAADLEGVAQLLTTGSAAPRCDYHCPLMSLALAFDTTLESVPAPARYLSSDAGKVGEWRARLATHRAPRIGLVWSGSGANVNDPARSIALEKMLAFLPHGPSYVSVQKDLREGEAALLAASAVVDYTAGLHDFSDTAALCDCLDLVLCVDTSVAHLSGALGKDTWVLLPFVPSWRWLLERSDSPWYSSVRLYRQTAQGSWAEPLRQVAADLRQRFNGRSE
jgi:hypothetical protein